MTGTDRLSRLYPARYRNQHGDEIAVVFEALRIRGGIGSAQPGGRALAAAAPFALGALAGIAVPIVLALIPQVFASTPSGGRAGIIVPLLDALPSILALVCALAGRQTATRVLLLAIAEKLAVMPLGGPSFPYLPWFSAVPVLGTAVFALLAVAAPRTWPPSTAGGRRRRS